MENCGKQGLTGENLTTFTQNPWFEQPQIWGCRFDHSQIAFYYVGRDKWGELGAVSPHLMWGENLADFALYLGDDCYPSPLFRAKTLQIGFIHFSPGPTITTKINYYIQMVINLFL